MRTAWPTSSVKCYVAFGKKKGLKICRAFAQGCGGEVVPAGITAKLLSGPAFFYGLTEDTIGLLKQAQEEGRTYFYCDNAYYFGRREYFRITRNALMHSGIGEADNGRLRAMGVEIKPWRDDGRHVVLATQSDLFYRMHLGVSRDEWTRAAIARVAQHTEREIVVCNKPAPGSPEWPHANFENVLPGAWAVVSYSSSVMVLALAQGVPVITLGPSMASCVGTSDLSRIEDPHYPDDRERWLAVLMANQWTMGEIRDGAAWRALNAG